MVMKVKNSKEPLWTKNFIILSIVNFFLTLIFFLLNATIAAYAINEFNASTSQAGLVAGIFIIGTLIGRLFIGRMINSTNPKKIIILGLSFYIVTALLYFADLGIGFLILSRLLNGFTFGIAATVIGTVVAITIPQHRKGEGISYFAISTALATGIGPFIGLFLSQRTSFQTIFSLCLILGIISLFTVLFIKISIENTRNNNNKPTRQGFKLSHFVEPKAIPISIIILTMALCFSSVLSYINIYASEIRLGSVASFFFVMYSAAVLVSRPFTGRLADRKGANYIMYPAFFLFGTGMILLGSTANSGAFLLAGLIIGLGFGNISSIAQTIAITTASPERLGLATATFFIFFEMGAGFGPSLLGLFIPITGYPSLYKILGCVILATSALYYFLHGKKESAKLKSLES